MVKAEIHAENEWKNNLVTWMLPDNVKAAMPFFVQVGGEQRGATARGGARCKGARGGEEGQLALVLCAAASGCHILGHARLMRASC